MDCVIDTQNLKILLGKKIKELRTKRSFTQEVLAEKIGVGQRNLSKIECGTNFLTAETLVKILIAFDIEPKELFDFDYLQQESILKEKLINALNNGSADIKQLYQFYQITRIK